MFKSIFILTILILFNSVFASNTTGNLVYLYTRVDTQTQESATVEVLKETLPERFQEFIIRINPNLTSSNYEDAFEIEWDESLQKIRISGTTGVSALFGLNFYLKYFCSAHIAWEGSQLQLPAILPRPYSKIRKEIVDRFRYYQNVCTESYSFVWWDWDRWKREINWMALNGINLPLAFTGQEAIWEIVYEKLGLSRNEIAEYITGPAFLAWWRMGNIEGWGGPMPKLYTRRKLALLKNILNRMRNLGMLPVLPAFSGNIPPALMKIYPNSTFHRHPNWAGFDSKYSATWMLDPKDPLFIKIGKMYIQELTAEVGTNHIYNCDAFNENRPAKNDSAFLQAVSRATFKSMAAGDPKAVWMMQGWIFMDFDFWSKDRVKSFLKGVDIGNLLILDLHAESMPLFMAFDSFFNHTWIWCMLHNFGGVLDLYGNMNMINKMLPLARETAVKGTFGGIGLTPEGINQNYVMYDFMTEMTLYKKPIDTVKWITKYSERRYGFQSFYLETAWKILQRSVYNNLIPGYAEHGRTIVVGRPRLNSSIWYWYSPSDLSRAVGYFLAEGHRKNSTALNSSLYLHDLVDFTRQFLIHVAEFVYKDLETSYFTRNLTDFWIHSAEFLIVMDDLEKLLSTNKAFLLGKWVHTAEKWSREIEEIKLLRYNSLVQVSTWGPYGEILDYASKQWAGMVSDYYKPRWALFLDSLEDSLFHNVTFNSTLFNHRVLTEVEISFANSSKIFPRNPKGNSFKEANRMYRQWKSRIPFTVVTYNERLTQISLNLFSTHSKLVEIEKANKNWHGKST